jgi:hypothetical protein
LCSPIGDGASCDPAVRELNTRPEHCGWDAHRKSKHTCKAIIDVCFDRNVDFIAEGVFARTPLPPGSPNLDRGHIWKQMIAEKLFMPTGSRGKSLECAMPIIRTNKSIADVIPLMDAIAHKALPECMDINRLRKCAV